MVYANGRLPMTALVKTATGHRLRADAANGYARMASAFHRDLGVPLLITDAYRDLAEQVLVKKLKGHLAAVPGTSVHGLGLALDLGAGVNVEGSAAHRWMDAHASEYGWVNPAWARDYDPRNGAHEPWHWEYVAHLDQHAGGTLAARPTPTPPPTPEDPDMARLIRHPNGSVAIVGPSTEMRVLHTVTEMQALQATGQATGEVIQLPNPLIWTTCTAVAVRAGTYSA